MITFGSTIVSDMSIREVRKLQTKDATVAKLFAKHIKLQDSIKFLKSTRTGIAVGTPQRLKALMDDGLNHCAYRKNQADLFQVHCKLTGWRG
jgi:protein CMS1